MAKWISFGDHYLNVEHIASVTEAPHGGALTVTMVNGTTFTSADVAQGRKALSAAGVPLESAGGDRPMGKVVRTDD